jgi:hypothetical protein
MGIAGSSFISLTKHLHTMKHTLLILTIALSIVACKKEVVTPSSDRYLETVKQGLRDSLTRQDFQQLDFGKSVLSKVDSVELYVLRIPFKGSDIGSDFVIVKTSGEGRVEQGKIIHHKGKATVYGEGGVKHHRWDGNITISSLNRKNVLESPIVNGFITAFHSNVNARTFVHEAGLMPEVVITYVIPSSGSVSWSTWMSFVSFFSQASANESLGGYYSWFDGGGSPGGGGGGSTGGSGNPPSGGGPQIDEPILIDLEPDDEKPGLDLQKYIKCFTAIPDAGSTCSIEISADIPVDSDPNKFYDFSTGSPGHVFLTVMKSNGSQHATLNIGFYPQSGYKASTYAPTAGKLVDNAGHEFNAALKMGLTPAQLSTVFVRIQQLSNLDYDTDEYNCTDWGLDIFNRTRTNKLDIPLYGIPGSPLTQHTRTPQGLYNKLQGMVNANDPEKGNITIGIYKGYAGGTSGPCN